MDVLAKIGDYYGSQREERFEVPNGGFKAKGWIQKICGGIWICAVMALSPRWLWLRVWEMVQFMTGIISGMWFRSHVHLWVSFNQSYPICWWRPCQSSSPEILRRESVGVGVTLVSLLPKPLSPWVPHDCCIWGTLEISIKRARPVDQGSVIVASKACVYGNTHQPRIVTTILRIMAIGGGKHILLNVLRW